MRFLVVTTVLTLTNFDAAPGCSGPRACTRDRSGTAATLAEDTTVQREPGGTTTDIVLHKGTEVRTHELRGEWVQIHVDEDTPTGGTSYVQGWIQARALAPKR
jgi:hypothetical protein